jgi:hypothetical protein
MTRLAEAIGGGLLAGVAGTAAMTASSTLEAKLRDRGSSSAPADAASKVLGVEPTDPALDVAPPVWEQPPQEVAIDAVHHAVYAGATSAAFAALA